MMVLFLVGFNNVLSQKLHGFGLDLLRIHFLPIQGKMYICMYQTENKSVQIDLRCVKIEQRDSSCTQLS